MKAELHSLMIAPSEVDASAMLPLWAYLHPEPVQLLGFSPFGDWFFTTSDGQVARIDLLEGRLDQVASGTNEFARLLGTDDGADELLLAGLVEALHRDGMRREAGQCYMYRVHPRLGGPIDRSNVLLGDMAVWQLICAQLHPQIDAAPASAVFAGLSVDEAGVLEIRWV